MVLWRKWSGMFALAAMLLPWPAATALALHEADDHVAPSDLQGVLHGHAHATGTAPHDHALTPSPNQPAGQLRAVFASTARAETVALSGLPLPPSTSAGAEPAETASPPFGSRCSKSILRI